LTLSPLNSMKEFRMNLRNQQRHKKRPKHNSTLSIVLGETELC